MLIPSKLSRPVRLQNTVVRDRLLVKLSSAANYRLTLINCPAGYGKNDAHRPVGSRSIQPRLCILWMKAITNQNALPPI